MKGVRVLEALIKSAKKGNNSSFAKLIKMIQHDLYRIAKVKLENEDDINDVLQDTILDMYTNLKQLKNNSFFKTWSISILLNNCNNILKSKYQNKAIVPLDEYKEILDSISDNNLYSNLNFEYIITILSQREKLVFTLYYQEDYKINEISMILNENENTIKSILRRGKEKIKKNYEKENLYG